MAQVRLLDLARRCPGQLVNDANAFGSLLPGDACRFEVGLYGLDIEACAGRQAHKGADAFADHFIGPSQHRGLQDGRMGGQNVLDLARRDVLAAADDDVFPTIDDGQHPRVVQDADVARIKEAVLGEGRVIQTGVEIADAKVRAHGENFAGRSSRDLSVLFIEEANRNEVHENAVG
ncbi:hypothetical protein D3C73_1177100 [compost metagenome]